MNNKQARTMLRNIMLKQLFPMARYQEKEEMLKVRGVNTPCTMWIRKRPTFTEWYVAGSATRVSVLVWKGNNPTTEQLLAGMREEDITLTF